MSKTAYVIISDLHSSYRDKDNRYAYLKEIEQVIIKITEIGLKYKQVGYDVILIFLGDIADRSFKELDKGIWLNNVFVRFRMLFKDIYSVLGNHETTYYKDNPFWTLMNHIDSVELKSSLNHAWQPKGLLQLINIPDRLEDGEVVFNFNHHATKILPVTPGKINIGLFHKKLAPLQLAKIMKEEKGLDVWEDSIEEFVTTTVLDGYDYCFMGHIHKIYWKGTFVNDISKYETQLYYLSSLGRPNVSEVADTFLERNIPAVLVTDGKLEKIEDNLFNLFDRETSVRETVVNAQQQTYKEVKKKREFYEHQIATDDPLENVRASLSSDPVLLLGFDEMLRGATEQRQNKLLNRAEEIRWL